MAAELTHDRLAAHELPVAAALLGRAFQESPNFVALYPDVGQRARVLPVIFTPALRDGLRHGEVHAARHGDELVAIAVWLPPGREKPGLWRKLRMTPDGMRIAWRAPAAAGRLAALSKRIDELRPERPHWYLAVLGVEPARHGTGIGSALLRPVLARADEERAASYLETPTRPNVAFYERFGFSVLREEVLLPDGPPNWTMLREPR